MMCVITVRYDEELLLLTFRISVIIWGMKSAAVRMPG